MPKEVKDRYSTVQIKSSLGRRLCPKRVVPQNTKKGEYEVQVAESVFMGLRAGRGNSKSSEHTETFTMGHGEEDFVDGICEVQYRV